MCVRAVVFSLARVLGLPVDVEEKGPCGRQRTGERTDVEIEDDSEPNFSERRGGKTNLKGRGLFSYGQR